MTNLIQIINAIYSGENSRSRRPLRYRSVLIALAFALFAVSPKARAVDPPPGDWYAGDNTASGEDALFNLTTGIHNTAEGYNTLFSNTTGFANTAVGWTAMDSNTIGVKNTVIGCDGLSGNTTGSLNTAVGVRALVNNTTGNRNVAMGMQAGENNNGSNNILLGSNAGRNLTTGSDNIDIGNTGVAGESNVIRIGQVGFNTATFIAGISGTAVAGGVTVIIDSNGQLGTMSSSLRFKKEIKPMDQTSEAILGLKPVTFHYKSDPAAAGPQFGLIAEEVAEVNPDLVVRDENGEIYTVRYDAVNAMLLNEFLKEHAKVEQLKKDFESKIAEQQKQIKALTVGLQKATAQIEASKFATGRIRLGGPAPQIVVDDQ
jgi:hypothetical protein